jgi:hypothetical protein
LEEFIARANIGPLAGELVLILLEIFFIGILGLAIGTLGLQQATGEVLTPYRGLEDMFLRSSTVDRDANVRT